MPKTIATLKNAVDTAVGAATPKTNYASVTSFILKPTLTTGSNYLLYYTNPAPRGATILNAKLRVWVQDAASQNFAVRTINQAYSAGRVTWNTKPTYRSDAVTVSAAAGTVATDGSYKQIEFDVKDHVQMWTNGTANYGWVMSIDTTARRVATTNSHLKPELFIEYATKPAKPVTAPKGTSVPVAEPWVRWSPVSGQTKFQVQVNTTSSFTSPAFDSGTVTDDDARYNLAVPAGYTGPALNDTHYFRVRVQDEGGIWSDWSDVQSFTYRTAPTCNITSPTTVFTDPTPTVEWTTSTSQTNAYVAVYEGSTLLHSSPALKTQQFYTLPAGITDEDDVAYTFKLHTHDAIEWDGGAFPYAEDSQTATYDYDPVTFTAFTAVEYLGGLGVELNWTTDSIPDRWNIKRDGKTLVTLDAEAVSGSYIDYTAASYKTYTYVVEAIVDGATPQRSQQETIDVVLQGIWILDPDDTSIRVQILGDDAGSWGMGEVSATHEPLNSNKVYKVTQALRGYEGSLSGELVYNPLVNMPVATQVSNMWKIKKQPSKAFIIKLSDTSFKAVLGNIVVAPSPLKELVKTVSFDFWSQDGVPK